MEPMVGQVILFAGNFAPRGWAFCEGQLIAITENQQLFSVLGTIYGGDGRSTFGLPDLRGRTPIQQGRGPDLSPHQLGQRGGTETNIMTVPQMPSHTHTAVVRAINYGGNGSSPDNNSLAETSEANYNSAAPNVNMHADSVVVANSGGGQTQNNMQPYLAMNYIIALVGAYPSRS